MWHTTHRKFDTERELLLTIGHFIRQCKFPYLACCGLLVLAAAIFVLESCAVNPGDSGSDGPELILSETSLNLVGAKDLRGPTDQLVIVTGRGEGALTYSVSESVTWMRILNVSGIVPDTFVIRFSIGGLAEGSYVDTIMAVSSEAANSPQRLVVHLDISPILQVSPATLDFALSTGSDVADTQYVIVSSNGADSIDYTAQSDADWLVVSPVAGFSPESLLVTVNPANLATGDYTGDITISSLIALNSPQVVSCRLSVIAWTQQQTPLAQDIRDIQFLDNDIGWAVGIVGSISEISGYIINTSDGGKNWSMVLLSSRALGSIDFVDNSNGWAVGGFGLILHTTDGGSSWQTQPTPAVADSVDLWDVDFWDISSGWAVGVEGTIMHTIDGGNSWLYQNSGVISALSGVHSVSPSQAWVVGHKGVILHTVDSGSTWTAQSSGITSDLWSVYFVDENLGWAVGKAGKVLHTTDGGENWTTQTSSTTEILSRVRFVDSQHGWIVGRDGTILHTSDAGANWSSQLSETNLWLFSVFFLDSSVGWVTGEQGVILKTLASGD